MEGDDSDESDDEFDAPISAAGPSRPNTVEEEEEAKVEEEEVDDAEEFAVHLRKGKPPVDIEKWKDDRYYQAEEMLRQRLDITQYDAIKDAALEILEKMYNLCYTEMGDMPALHAKMGHTYSNGELFVYDPDAPDIFRDHYKTLGSASLWACFALQQAYYEFNHKRFECGDPDMAEAWQIENLHSMLIEAQGDKFQSFEGPSDYGQGAHTLVGANVKSIKKVANRVNKEAMGQKTRRLNVHSIGPKKRQKEKALTFAYVFRRTFDYRVRPFCIDIVELNPMLCSSHNFQSSGSVLDRVTAQKASSWGKRVADKHQHAKGIQQKMLNHPILRPPPEEEKQTIRLVSREDKAIEANRRLELQQKQKALWKEQTDDVKLCIYSEKDVRLMDCTDTKNTAVEDEIAKAAMLIRARRDTIDRTAKAVSVGACANVVKRASYELRKEEACREVDRLQAAREATIDAISAIRRKCVYGIDCDDDKEPGEWIEGAFDLLSQEEKDLYLKGAPPEVNPMDVPGFIIRQPKLEPSVKVPFPPACTRTSRIDTKVPAPGTPLDYAMLFKFNSVSDAKNELARINKRIMKTKMKDGCDGDDEDDEDVLEPWQIWMFHVMVGQRPRLDQDLVEYADKYRKALLARKYRLPVIKGVDKDGNITDNDLYLQSMQHRNSKMEQRKKVDQRIAERKKRSEEKKHDEQEAKRQKREERELTKDEREIAEAMRKAQNESMRAQDRQARASKVSSDKTRKADAAFERHRQKVDQLVLKRRRSHDMPVFVKQPRVNSAGHLVRKGQSPLSFTQVNIPDFRDFDFKTPTKMPESFFIKVTGFSHKIGAVWNEEKDKGKNKQVNPYLCGVKYDDADTRKAQLEKTIYKKVNTNTEKYGVLRVPVDWYVLEPGTEDERRERARQQRLGMIAPSQ
jgi:hypothetical protein